MKITFPIGTKTKCFVDKINITAQLQCVIDKDIKSFYHHIPLKKEPFDNPVYKKYENINIKKKSKNVTKKIKK
jgi:hypothetical protein